MSYQLLSCKFVQRCLAVKCMRRKILGCCAIKKNAGGSSADPLLCMHSGGDLIMVAQNDAR